MGDSRSRLVCGVAGGLAGVVMTAVAAARLGEGHLESAHAVIPTLLSAVGGGVSGPLFGFLIWALWKPRQRIAKAAVVLGTLNCAAWLLFLAANTPLSGGGASIRDHRVQLDRDAALGWPNGLTFTNHPSALLASRVNSWVHLSEKPLGLFAGPAVVFVHEQIVPPRYWQAGATVAESNWIALGGLVVSTAWWVSAGSMLRFLKRRGVAGRRVAPTD
jgi:hypothetical protein